jgi:hypothetical protein
VCINIATPCSYCAFLFKAVDFVRQRLLREMKADDIIRELFELCIAEDPRRTTGTCTFIWRCAYETMSAQA